jgi:hypothetical protein
MTPRGQESTLGIAAAHRPIGPRRLSIRLSCDHTVHAKSGIRLHLKEVLEIIVAPRGKVPPEYGPDTATGHAPLTNK